MTLRRRGRSRSGSRRKSRWEGTYSYLPLVNGTSVPTVAGTSNVSAVWARVPAGAYDTVNGDNVTDDCTVYRMINSIQFGVIKTVAAGSIELTYGAGIIAWDGIDDTAPPVTDIPFPVQSGGYDWLWWWAGSIQLQNFAVNAYATPDNLFGPDHNVFTKSMRKLSTGTGLLLVVECYAMISGMQANYGWSHNGRYAVKLP